MIPAFTDPNELAEFAATIPEMAVKAEVGHVWQREAFHCLAIREAGQIVSYMVGRPQATDTYFIWLCGTAPAARGKGYAKLLLKAHENLANAAGCSWVTVDSKNRYPAMLITLIRSGYKIYHIEVRESDDLHAIQFHKQLANQAMHR
ncbi:MAG: GNAT family N-acetyltransferase [Chloroflexi bacterium]|nr:GNAT family N-acetyltransferase [Chloroflexota bacterium]